MSAYIVTFKKESEAVEATDDHIESLAKHVESSGGSIKHRYNSRILRGFAGTFSDDIKKQLESNPNVKSIEPDAEVRLSH
ncbi:hypothetical protein T439DRAFT_324560 [Meredithblackwellia eburnea MCA 4105]